MASRVMTGRPPSLYAANRPEQFWKLVADPAPREEQWAAAVLAASGCLPERATSAGREADAILEAVLGEGQFGPDHWRLSFAKRTYYDLKPLLPRPFTRLLRRAYRGSAESRPLVGWPIEPRYADFLIEVVRQVLEWLERDAVSFVHFWPYDHSYAFVLTHDVETAEGQAAIPTVADLEERHGFRSSFNLVPARYPLDRGILRDLRDRGFEVGVHDLNHDGKLFRSEATFTQRAARINGHLREMEAAGFRAALTHRQPAWMQQLDVAYDLSFFDTDPYEPIPGGTMSLWPFLLGRFVELPYTLVQDYTLISVLGERSPRVWLEKVDFLEAHRAMALVNSHPDYLRAPVTGRVYEEFLDAMAARTGYWHALPREVARWWGLRAGAGASELPEGARIRTVSREGWSSIQA